MATSYKKWVNQLVLNLINYMDLAGWTVEVVFEPKTHPDDSCVRWADISVTFPYSRAVITIYPPTAKAFKDGDLDEVHDTVVHEMCHIILEPFSAFVRPHLSSVTAPFFNDIMEKQNQHLTELIKKAVPIPPR